MAEARVPVELERKHSTPGHDAQKRAQLEVSRMELRSGKNVISTSNCNQEVSVFEEQMAEPPRSTQSLSRMSRRMWKENEESERRADILCSTPSKLRKSTKSVDKETEESELMAEPPMSIKTPPKMSRKSVVGENEESKKKVERSRSTSSVSRLRRKSVEKEKQKLEQNAEPPRSTPSLSRMSRRMWKENEESVSEQRADIPRSTPSKSRKSRKSVDKENEESEQMAEPPMSITSPPNMSRKSMRKENEESEKKVEPPWSTPGLSRIRRKSVGKERKESEKNAEPPRSTKSLSRMKKENEESVSGQRADIPCSTPSKSRKSRKSEDKENQESEQMAEPQMSIKSSQKMSRKSVRRENEESEQEIEPPWNTPSLSRIRRKSMGKENEKSDRGAEIPRSTPSKSRMSRKSMDKENEESAKRRRLSFIVIPTEESDTSKYEPPPQENKITSTCMITNEENTDLSDLVANENDDLTETLNSTFEVAKEDSILQTPSCKRSVRFADSIETRRRTRSLSGSENSTPILSVADSQHVFQRSQHKGTPHPSSKKRPSSILKSSSSKKTPVKEKNSSVKVPNFSSIHKAQFEKMESIDDFTRRRRRCARKLEELPCLLPGGVGKTKPMKHSTIVNPDKQGRGNAATQALEENCKIEIPAASTDNPSSKGESSGTTGIILTENKLKAHSSKTHVVGIKSSFANSRMKNVTNHNNCPKPHRATYEQAKAMIQNKCPDAAQRRSLETAKNRNILKGVRLNRRFELQMQHRKLNIN